MSTVKQDALDKESVKPKCTVAKKFFTISISILSWFALLWGVYSYIPKGSDFLSWLSGFVGGFGGLAGVAAIAGVFYTKTTKDKKETAKSEELKAIYKKKALEIQSSLSPDRQAFLKALETVFSEAEKRKESSISVNSGKLHRQVGGYPGHDHRLSTCCSVMYAAFQEGRDTITESPPKGEGASLTIEYKLPRFVQAINGGYCE